MLYPGLLHPEPLPPAAGHCSPVPLQETLKHSSGSVSVGSLGPSAHKVFLSPLRISASKEFDSKRDFAPPTSCWGFSFALGHEVSLQSGSSAYHLTGASLSLDMTEGKFSSLSLLRVDEDQINQTTAKG